jgi:hypothetical protein
MTTRTLTCPLPENINPLSPNGYMFTLQRLPELSYFCQEVSLPAITLPEATQLNPFSKIPLSGDQIDFDTLRVQFLIDDKMKNYRAIHDWIVGLGFPENNSQYTQTIEVSNMPGLSEVAKSTSDATLIILGNNNMPIQAIQFADCVPESLESITFVSNNQDVQYLIGSASFRYTYYKFI